MKKFEKLVTEQDYLTSIICDCCKKEYLETDIFEIEEFLSISKMVGYGSIFGDESIIELDLCQHCVKNFLGNYIRIEERNI